MNIRGIVGKGGFLGHTREARRGDLADEKIEMSAELHRFLCIFHRNNVKY